MKKSIFIIMFIMVAIGIKSMAAEKVCYVSANGNTYFGKELKQGLFKTKIVSADGKVFKVKNHDINSYSDGKHQFEKLPVICENNDTLCMAMMEYITSRNGLKLYRYTCLSEGNDLLTSTFRKAHKNYGYFVFKDGKFYLRINEKNAAATFPFFGIEVIS
ncbi:MAG: hypothetical protein ACOYMF_00350 [Bacteroidales bacterium]